MANSVPPWPGDFESVAQQYWSLWGDALRQAGATPSMSMPGAAPGWQQTVDWWSKLVPGGQPQVDEAVGRFQRQASQWFGQMQQVAAQFSGRDHDATDIGRAWRLPRQLDTDAMHDAAQKLVGKHDFTTFRDTECQAKSPEKTLDQLDVVRNGDHVSIITSARSFLHNQVRSMVGSLALVGDGKWSADDLSAALAAKNRAACAPVAPPEGLYLVRVDY